MTSRRPAPDDVPQGWVTRDELAAEHDVSRSVLDRLWRARATNGHPDPVRYGGAMHWDSAAWGRWHAQHQRDTAARKAAELRYAPPILTGGDPNEEIGSTAFARILGHRDHTWVAKAALAPPPGFPEPDSWGDPEGRKRPKWRRGRAEQYARDRRATPPARPGRPKGSRNTQPHSYAGDPRLTLARQVLEQHPDETSVQHIERLQTLADRPASASTWTKILKTAREHPKES